MANKASRFYIISIGVLLIVVSVAKFWSAFGTARILAREDPVFGISYRVVMIAAAVVELAIGSICLSRLRLLLSATLIAWFSTTVLLYRVGAYLLGDTAPCRCLGNLSDALHLSPSTADIIARIVLAYCLVGSWALLAKNWRRQRQFKQSAQLKPT